MTSYTPEQELTQFLQNTETASWNRMRTSNELQAFLADRLEASCDYSDISL